MVRSRIVALAIRTLVLLALVWPVWGCGKTQPRADMISGTVSYNGKLLTYGSIEFSDASGKQKRSFIGMDGSYSIPNDFEGEVKVVVTTGSAPVPASSPGGPDGKKIKFEKTDLPARYSDPEKTDLRFQVSKGPNHIDIDMKPDPK